MPYKLFANSTSSSSSASSTSSASSASSTSSTATCVAKVLPEIYLAAWFFLCVTDERKSFDKNDTCLNVFPLEKKDVDIFKDQCFRT